MCVHRGCWTRQRKPQSVSPLSRQYLQPYSTKCSSRKSSTAAGLKRSPEESPTASQVAQDLYQTSEHNNPSPSRVIGALHTQAQGQTLPSIPESDADQLFTLLFETLNVRGGRLQREMHTPAFCQKVSPFLYNTGTSIVVYAQTQRAAT